MYAPNFNREEYWENRDSFESEDGIYYADSELSEFNEDIEALAFEVAYLRYYLTKAEKKIDILENCIKYGSSFK